MAPRVQVWPESTGWASTSTKTPPTVPWTMVLCYVGDLGAGNAERPPSTPGPDPVHAPSPEAQIYVSNESDVVVHVSVARPLFAPPAGASLAPLLRRPAETGQRVPDTEESALNALLRRCSPVSSCPSEGPSPLHTHRMVGVIGPSVLWRRD